MYFVLPHTCKKCILNKYKMHQGSAKAFKKLKILFRVLSCHERSMVWLLLLRIEFRRKILSDIIGAIQLSAEKYQHKFWGAQLHGDPYVLGQIVAPEGPCRGDSVPGLWGIQISELGPDRLCSGLGSRHPWWCGKPRNGRSRRGRNVRTSWTRSTRRPDPAPSTRGTEAKEILN